MMPSPPPLEVYLLGLEDFDEIQQLERRLVYEQAERGGGALILCEHPPTISVGRAGSRVHILPDDEELRAWGIGVHWINRGGGCVLHLPGQLAAYLVLPLAPLGLSLAAYLDGLHGAIDGVLEEFDLRGQRHADAPGVFLGGGRVASVGIGVSRWVAYHGFTLNVGPYLSPFHLIAEPGPGGGLIQQTSMESRRQRPAPMHRVRETLVRRVEMVFGLERHHVYTDHPQVRRKERARVYAQSLG
jgi:lipoyl(octanoyl) transferase